MKRVLAVALCVAFSIGVGWSTHRAATRVQTNQDGALSRFVPAGALLYIQAKDFGSLLSDWNRSNEKDLWLKSSNYEVFSRSRLFLRLKDANTEFSRAAGVPTDSNLLAQFAGKETALAVFDIGKLEFLFISHQPASAVMQSSLWQTRGQFETRTVAEKQFFVRRDPESGREVAFGVAGDYVLLATREDLLAGALQLIAGSAATSVETEAWFAQASAAAGPAKTQSDLRMVLNLEKLVPSPYFRSYWIQQNITDMKQYEAAVSDLTRTGDEYREDRILVRKKAASPEGTQAASSGIVDILRFVPAQASVYAARTNPTPAECLTLLEGKILAPTSYTNVSDKSAPQVELNGGAVGSATDLETRIDEPVTQAGEAKDRASALKTILGKTPVIASLTIQSTSQDASGVFVRIHSAVVLSAQTPWQEQAVLSALADFAAPTLTTSALGLGWERSASGSQLRGLWPLVVKVQGKYLFISNDEALLASVLAATGQNSPQDSVVFAGGFDHQKERADFLLLTSLLDHAAGGATQGGAPAFFSDNLSSWSTAFARLASEKIVIRDQGDKVNQTVTYAWAR